MRQGKFIRPGLLVLNEPCEIAVPIKWFLISPQFLFLSAKMVTFLVLGQKITVSRAQPLQRSETTLRMLSHSLPWNQDRIPSPPRSTHKGNRKNSVMGCCAFDKILNVYDLIHHKVVGSLCVYFNQVISLIVSNVNYSKSIKIPFGKEDASSRSFDMLRRLQQIWLALQGNWVHKSKLFVVCDTCFPVLFDQTFVRTREGCSFSFFGFVFFYCVFFGGCFGCVCLKNVLVATNIIVVFGRSMDLREI